MDLDQYIKFLMALLFVVGLIVAVAWLMRRIGLGGMATGTIRHRRLGVVEVLPLDAKRRLVLVRQDDREHLILLSATGDRVVESGPTEDFRAALAATAATTPPPPPPPAVPAATALPQADPPQAGERPQ